MIQNNKKEFINVRVPNCAIIGESKHSYLINGGEGKYLWFSKNCCHIPENSISTNVSIGIVKGWNYKLHGTEKEINSEEVQKLLSNLYFHYQNPVK
ncbi:MAG: hypothetical protein ACRCXE_03265 [Metamycoplasmataceae bacterium]